MGMYSSRAVTLLVLISDDVINRILKLNIQTNILVYVTRCCTDLTSKVLKERTFGQSSALLQNPVLDPVGNNQVKNVNIFTQSFAYLQRNNRYEIKQTGLKFQ